MNEVWKEGEIVIRDDRLVMDWRDETQVRGDQPF
jgi:hypothetical protein